MKMQEVLLAAGAVAIAAAGFFLDRTIGYDAFQRSGALMVAYGVALAGREIYLGERAIARNEGRMEKIEAAYLDAAKDSETSGPPEEAFSRLATALSEYRQSRLDRVGRMVFAEIAIVCAGTLIWGFGDLVV